MPAVMYIHPWEVDPEQPRIAARWSNRFRHYKITMRKERYLFGLTNKGSKNN